MKEEHLACEESLEQLQVSQADLENKKKKLIERREEINDEIKSAEDSLRGFQERKEEINDEIKSVEDSLSGFEERKKRVLDKRNEASDEVKRIEDSLRDLFSNLKLEPLNANQNLISFLTKSIEEKKEALECPAHVP